MNNFIKHLDTLETLPPLDQFRALADWHTVNAKSFYGSEIVEKTSLVKTPLKVKDVLKDAPVKDLEKAFHDGFEFVRKYFRNNAKAPGLAIMYGGGVDVLISGFGVSKDVAIRMFSRFMKSLSTLKIHLSDRVATALVEGYVETLFGARLYLPMLKDPKKKNAGIRKVYNSPIQGSASNLIHIFILKVSDYIEKYTLNKLQGNNITKVINGEYYNRILTTNTNRPNALNKELDSLPNGHTRVLILDNQGHTRYVYDRAVNISYIVFEKYQMEIYH